MKRVLVSSRFEILHLNLAACGLGNGGAAMLASGLARRRFTRRLSVADNNITERGAMALFEALSATRDLEQLDVAWNSIGHAAVCVERTNHRLLFANATRTAPHRTATQRNALRIHLGSPTCNCAVIRIHPYVLNSTGWTDSGSFIRTFRSTHSVPFLLLRRLSHTVCALLCRVSDVFSVFQTIGHVCMLPCLLDGHELLPPPQDCGGVHQVSDGSRHFLERSWVGPWGGHDP